MPQTNTPSRRFSIRDPLLGVLGWKATILHGDPTVVDRWRWLSDNLTAGDVRTLDAGCGSGAFTMYARMCGNNALGIAYNGRDIDKAERRAADLGLDRVEFIQGDLREMDEEPGELGLFDQILLFECIEHIIDDRKLVRALAGHLKPGGKLLLTAPYSGHHPLWGETWSEVEDGGHVRYGYTHDEMRAILEAAGFEIVREDYLAGLVSQKLASLQFALCRIHPLFAWAVTFPLRIFLPLDGPLTRLTNYPGLSIATVARKAG